MCGDSPKSSKGGASSLRQAVVAAISQIDSVAVGREAGDFAHEPAEDAESVEAMCWLEEG